MEPVGRDRPAPAQADRWRIEDGRVVEGVVRQLEVWREGAQQREEVPPGELGQVSSAQAQADPADSPGTTSKHGSILSNVLAAPRGINGGLERLTGRGEKGYYRSVLELVRFSFRARPREREST